MRNRCIADSFPGGAMKDTAAEISSLLVNKCIPSRLTRAWAVVPPQAAYTSLDSRLHTPSGQMRVGRAGIDIQRQPCRLSCYSDNNHPHSQHAMYHSPLNRREGRATGSRWPRTKRAEIQRKRQSHPIRMNYSSEVAEEVTTAAVEVDNMNSIDQREINVHD
ncbi:hypothetical protein M405DRAFT_417795 [Rhizopogon salebrosus TDB-379]|nr:hypothetical protein M405DRAFT_417795 [Rhizopogon salebrosus TDB-379]